MCFAFFKMVGNFFWGQYLDDPVEKANVSAGVPSSPEEADDDPMQRPKRGRFPEPREHRREDVDEPAQAPLQPPVPIIPPSDTTIVDAEHRTRLVVAEAVALLSTADASVDQRTRRSPFTSLSFQCNR